MTENAEKIVYIVTHSGEDPERASLPFMLANAALVMDVQATVVLQGNGVYLGKKGYAVHVNSPEAPPLQKLMDDFLEAGGKVLVCVPCCKARNIAEEDLIEGAKFTAAGVVTDELLSSSASLVY